MTSPSSINLVSIVEFVKVDKLMFMNWLGEGSYSQVFKVQRQNDGRIYALKKVSMDSLSTRERNNALNEVRILASIDHGNIVQYKEAFTDSEKYLCVVMEFADDGDLYQKITDYRKQKQRFDEK